MSLKTLKQHAQKFEAYNKKHTKILATFKIYKLETMEKKFQTTNANLIKKLQSNNHKTNQITFSSN